MNSSARLLLAPFLLAACTSDPGGTNTDFGMTPNTAPDEVAANLRAVDYDPVTQELVLNVTGIHGGEENATYVRTPALDTSGYEGYMLQRTAADRHYTALFGESNDGELIAGVVADGGNNNRFFGGGFFGRQGLGVYSPYDHAPTDGEAQYLGQYAGVTDLNGNGDQLLDASAIDPDLTPPAQADRIVGDILLNADFANLQVDAEISNRFLVDDILSLGQLPDIALVATTIDSEGAFTGDVEYEGVINTSIGTYSGIFGGNGATSVAGVVYLSEYDGPAGLINGEEEYGVFILTRCGASGADAGCAGL